MICSRCGRAGHVAQKDSTAPEMPAGTNCRRSIGQQAGTFDPPGPKYFQRTIDRSVDLLRRWAAWPRTIDLDRVSDETNLFLSELDRPAADEQGGS